MKWILVTVVVLFVPLQAAANSLKGLQFSMDLTPIRVYARPGELINRNFQLTLAKDAKKTYFGAKTEDWWPSSDGKQSFYRKHGTLQRSCGSWVTLNPVETSVEPGGTLNVKVSIAVPHDVKPGGSWCVLTVDETLDPTAQMEGVAVKFLASVSVGIFVYVEPVKREARISGVKVLPDDVRVRISNEGNCPLGVEGRVEFLRAVDEKPVALAKIPRRTLVTEPVRSFELVAGLPDVSDLPSGKYLVRVILDIGLDAYIGVQKEIVIRRETGLLRASTP